MECTVTSEGEKLQQPVAGSNRTSALTTTCARGATGGGGAAAGTAETGSAGLGIFRATVDGGGDGHHDVQGGDGGAEKGGQGQ